MARLLPDPPATLVGAPRSFYDELLEMLAAVAPSQIDADKTQVAFDRDGIAGAYSVHEHFSARDETDETRPWTTQMVDFLAELLRGEIEIETTFRGETAITAKHYNRDEGGQRVLLGQTGFLSPGRLAFWRPRRTETERVSFA